jgi:hypothetical protein
MGVERLSQVLKETKLGVAPTPKYFTSLESGILGNVNTLRGLHKYEAMKRLAHTHMRIAPRFGCTGPKGKNGSQA